MNCLRATDCSMAPKLDGANRLMRVLRTLYCDRNPHECARVKWAGADHEVPPDMMPNGISTSELEEAGL